MYQDVVGLPYSSTIDNRYCKRQSETLATSRGTVASKYQYCTVPLIVFLRTVIFY